MGRPDITHQAPGVQDSLPDVSSGAVWHRVDLHLHSPQAHTFRFPDGCDLSSPEGRGRLVEAYVHQLEASGITVAAITDYNGIHPVWFEAIRNEAVTHGIMVLPGAELRFRAGKYGLHLLAVFPGESDPEDINRYLTRFGPDGAPLVLERGDPKAISERPEVVVRQLRERFQSRCLIIVAHPDDDNGLFKSFSHGDAADLLREIAPDAIEAYSPRSASQLQSTGQLPRGFLESLATVEFSDAHSLDEIGTKVHPDGTPRATYLKLSSRDLNALRLALHDPSTRLALGRPPRPNHSRIVSMVAEGSGFLGNLSVQWNDDLNTLIGGRGTGKSAILETLRYALGFRPYAEADYRESLVRHALGSGGKVTITLARPVGEGSAHRYRVTRVFGEDPVVEDVETGSLLPVAPVEVFGPGHEPVILGQREVQVVSSDERYRLRLLDELIGEEIQRAEREVRKILELVEVNANQIRVLESRLAERPGLEQQLRNIEKEIDVYEREGIAGKLRTYMDLTADRQSLARAVEILEVQQQAWRETTESVSDALNSAVSELRTSKSIHASVLQEAAASLSGAVDELNELARRGETSLLAVSQKLHQLQDRWRELLRPLEEELTRIKRSLHSDVLSPDRLLELTRQRAALAPAVKELGSLAGQLEALRTHRRELLKRYRDARHKAHALRRSRCEAIESRLRGRLRITVQFKGNKREYKEALGALLKGSGVTDEALELLVAPEATDGIALSEAIMTGLSEVQARFGLTERMAKRVVDWFKADQARLMRLEVLAPSDTVKIELVVEGTPRPLERLSIGQRATAILLLLFALEGRPLILDQPEDDLDNRFVYEDIVALLREQKSPEHRRQVICATHNPNIPVLGDAELVLSLDSRDGKVHVLGRASIDDRATRQLVRTLLEGGEEAFRRRAEKYGGIVWT